MASYKRSPPPNYQYVPPRPTQHDTRTRAEQTSESEPLFLGRERKQPWYSSHLMCITIASAIVLFVVIPCTVVNATLPGRNSVQWERDLARRKTIEKTRELEWDRQMEQRREEERIREQQWNVGQEQRERLGLYWDLPTPGRCTAYGVRDYRAQLLNAAPFHYNWLQPCGDMPAFIQGSMRTADRCELVGNEIWGHWNVKGESVCTPFFENWRDNGCMAPGSQLRLASARLDYVPTGENGLDFCGSTPHKFWDRTFSHPTTCAKTNGDVWGYWEVEDGRC